MKNCRSQSSDSPVVLLCDGAPRGLAPFRGWPQKAKPDHPAFKGAGLCRQGSTVPPFGFAVLSERPFLEEFRPYQVEIGFCLGPFLGVQPYECRPRTPVVIPWLHELQSIIWIVWPY